MYDPGTADGWKGRVRSEAHAHRPATILTGPVQVCMVFTLPRPKAHFLKSGLRPTAPSYHTGKPDSDNLAKAVLDALGDTAQWWKDDAQVARLSVLKNYGDEAGCRIVISEMLP